MSIFLDIKTIVNEGGTHTNAVQKPAKKPRALARQARFPEIPADVAESVAVGKTAHELAQRYKALWAKRHRERAARSDA